MGQDNRMMKDPIRLDVGGRYLHANHASSSSRLVDAGSGAPGCSWVGNLTYPPSPKGFHDESRSMTEGEDVEAGMSASRRLHPREFIESLKDCVAILRGFRDAEMGRSIKGDGSDGKHFEGQICSGLQPHQKTAAAAASSSTDHLPRSGSLGRKRESGNIPVGRCTNRAANRDVPL